YQWDYCGGNYRVQKVMRSIVDDQGIFRPISRTILLEGVCCGGISGAEGCGRECPLMFRDEWVKPALPPSPTSDPASRQASTYMRVRPAREILASLDGQGK